MTILHELRAALRSLARAKGLSATVVVTLALGIGANAGIMSLVRAVLLKPLVNRDESRIVYIRQSAPGIGAANTTFSVPEIQDMRERVTSLTALAEFSTLTFTMVGLGEPRQVRSGVVNGSFFEVMGLRPIMGRLLTEQDDGPSAEGAAVLTYRFWANGLQSDPTVIGKTIRLGTRSATIVGVLEPSVPYPQETEIIANMVTSPHHLSATMETGREHRMTEVFGRLAPGAELENALAELRTVHGSIVREYPEAYSPRAAFQLNAVILRDQITARARTILLVLLAAAVLVFLIAVSNAANLILARTVRREGELVVRAALGGSHWALRRTLLAESLLLCGTGAVLGLLIAQPMTTLLARYASRYSVRALDVTLDASFLGIAAGLALVAAVLLAFVPRLPSGDSTRGFRLSSGSVRVTGATNRRLRAFAVTQIALSFVLLAGAGMLLRTFLALQGTDPGFETARVLAVNVPIISFGKTPQQVLDFYREVQARIATVPGVARVAIGSTVPWRDAGGGAGIAFRVVGAVGRDGNDDPRARLRSVSPGYFAALGVPLTAGRDFNDADRAGTERVVIVSASLAQQMFPGQEVLNRQLTWSDPVIRFIGITPEPQRIVGVVPDIDDERINPAPAMTVYHPFEQQVAGGRVFVQTTTDPYSLVPAITKIIRDLATDQPVEQAATLADVRAEVLAPDRLNTLVFGGFAAVALVIAIVGVAGVLAFSVSGRIREFGVRLMVGSQPQSILMGVLRDGLTIASIGIVSGALGGLAIARLAASYVEGTQMPSALPIIGSAAVLLLAAVIASLVPAMRAARVDVMSALRSE